MSIAASSPSRPSARTLPLVARALVALLVALVASQGPLSALADDAPAPPVEAAVGATLTVRLVDGLTAEQQQAVVTRHGGTQVSSVAPLRLHVVSVAGDDLSAAVERYRSDPEVESAEADAVRTAEGTPSDPVYADQWALPKIAWDEAFGTVDPAGEAAVAVLDTGVDASHPDLAGRVRAGISFVEGATAGDDPNGHGTALATIAAAATGDGVGMAGVAYAGVDVVPVTVLDADGLGQDSDIIEGVVWAADQGADVILMGFSNPGFSQHLQDAVDYAWSKGAVLVAATGNDGSSEPAYPAGDAKVVGVSATDESDALWSGSNRGAAAFLGAPGVGMIAGSAGGGLTSITGTSASAAVVAGAAALLSAADPGASNGTVVGRLARNADPAGTVEDTGNGRVNLARALADTSADEVVPAGAAPSGDGGPVVGPYRAAANATYTGTVTDASTSAPISGATVSCAATADGCNNAVSATTNGSGAYSLTVQFSGGTTTLTLTASSSGYASASQSVSTSGPFTGRNFALTPAPVCTAPAITDQPDDATVVVGEAAGFSVTATGSGTLSYQWKKGATNVGSDSSSYSIAAAALSDAGSYTVVVSNACGSATSDAATLTVDKASTTTGLTSSVNPSAFGQSVTFTATPAVVSPGSGTPTGTVTFKNGAATLASGVAIVSGTASFSTSALAVGTHSITAEYIGDSNFNGSTSSAVSQVVAASPTTTTITSHTPDPSVTGQSVVVAFSVAASGSGSGTPTGSVTVSDGSSNCGDTLVAGAGSCTLVITSAGAKTLTATYAGSTSFAGSFGTASHTVSKAETTTGLVSSVNPSVFGQSVTFTATVLPVSPGGGVPAGNVVFRNGAATLDTVALSAGAASLSVSTLAVSTTGHSITAEYLGNANYLGSTSDAVAQVVNKASTTTGLTSSVNPSAFGQSVTFTATVAAVSPGTGTPTGTVTFKDGTTTLGTGTLDASGVATLATSSLAVGSHSITAEYGGSGNYATSASSAVSQVVNQGASATTITSDAADPSVTGQGVTVAVSVAAVAPAAGTPTGAVDVSSGTDTCTVTLSSGAGSCVLVLTSAGPKTITAAYGGDTNFASSSDDETHTVNKADTTTSLASSANPSVFGQPVTFTATVAANSPGSGVPTGTVAFKDGTTTLGTDTLNASGAATRATSSLAVGSHSITAEYPGDGNYNGDTSDALNQVVNKADTTTAITGDAPDASVTGQSVTVAFTVSPVAPGAGTPTGTVTVTVSGGSETCNATVAAGSCSVTLTKAGSRTLTATYAGDGSFNGSSDIETHTVNKADTTTSLASSANPSVFGQPVTFTATVAANSPGSGVPTGTVTFKDGTTTLGTDTLSASGAATLATSSLAVGSHSITAEYGGDDDYNGDTSDALNQVVNKADTTVTVTSFDPATTVTGQPVTVHYSVAVSSPGAGTPTGNVTITVSGGSETCSASIVAGGCSLTPTSAGARTFTASYLGDGNFNGDTGDASHTIDPAGTSTALTSSVNPSVFGQSVTFTATVSAVAPGSGTPTGNVQFKNGSADLGSPVALASGQATLATSALAVGTHSITAVYGGTVDYNGSTSSAVSQVVDKANTTTTLASSANPSTFGDSVTFTATVAPVSPGGGTPAGNVQFKKAGVDFGSPVALDASGQAALSTSALAVGSHSITAVYLGGTSHNGSTSAALSQVVNPAPTTTAVTVTPSTQQYSDLVTFEATISPAQINGVAPATGVTFKVGTQVVGSATLAADGGVLKATLADVALLEPVPFGTSPTGQMAPGARTVTAVFTGVSSSFVVTDATTSLTIMQEDARATYTGALFASTSCGSCSGANVTLAATVADISATADAAGDTNAGDIRNARVTFVNRDAGNAAISGCSNLQPGLASASDVRVGTVTCTWNVDIGSQPFQTFTVGVVVSGYYTRDHGADNVVVNVAKPGTNFITGGGYLVLASSGGVYAGDVGSRNNFGLNVKFNKNKTNLQGNINTIVRRDGRVYQVKGNQMTSLAVSGNPPKYATFNGKASIQDITDPDAPVSVDGNATLQVTMTDNGEPGSSDTIGITVWNKSGGLWFASRWDGSRTVEQVLAGGNLQVK